MASDDEVSESDAISACERAMADDVDREVGMGRALVLAERRAAALERERDSLRTMDMNVVKRIATLEAELAERTREQVAFIDDLRELNRTLRFERKAHAATKAESERIIAAEREVQALIAASRGEETNRADAAEAKLADVLRRVREYDDKRTAFVDGDGDAFPFLREAVPEAFDDSKGGEHG